MLRAQIGSVLIAATVAMHAIGSEPADCATPPPLPQQCIEGAIGNGAVEPFASLSTDEVRAIVNAAASSLDNDMMTVAVVDRGGRVLALFRRSSAEPANDDAAVG